ncbi:MAG: biotin--[acetyl-CoA-carboxylase] ligase [Bacillota bacterium]
MRRTKRWFRRREVKSTQDWARDLLKLGRARDRAVVMARVQLGGRGRGGKYWVSPRGGLWMTRISPLKRDYELRGLYPLAAGIAAVEAIGELSPAAVSLKWPNDLLWRDKKLGGILCETAGNLLLVGLGVNVAADFSHLRFSPRVLPPINLVEVDARWESDGRVAIERLAQGFDRQMFLWDERLDAEPTAIIEEWKNRSTMLGRQVSVVSGQTAFSAEVRDLDPSGRLVVATPSGEVHRLSSADVSLRFGGEYR